MQVTRTGFLHKRSDNFGKLPEKLMHDKSVTDGATRMYAHMHWRYGSNCDNHEGRGSMADYFDISETTVTNRINELEAKDWVVTISHGEHDGRTWNEYHVFEVQEDAIKWRAEHNVTKPEFNVKSRKSRKNVGGRRTHRQKDEVATETQVSGAKETQVPVAKFAKETQVEHPAKLEFSTPLNSSSHYPDSIDPDSLIQTQILSAGAVEENSEIENQSTNPSEESGDGDSDPVDVKSQLRIVPHPVASQKRTPSVAPVPPIAIPVDERPVVSPVPAAEEMSQQVVFPAAPEKTRWIFPLEGGIAHLVRDANQPTVTLCGIRPLPSQIAGGEAMPTLQPCLECLAKAANHTQEHMKPIAMWLDSLKEFVPKTVTIGVFARISQQWHNSGVTEAEMKAAAEIFKAWITALPGKPVVGWTVPEVLNNANAALGLLTADIVSADVAKFVKEKKEEQFWAGKIVPFEYVAKNIPTWKAENKPKPSETFVDDPENPGKQISLAQLRSRQVQRDLHKMAYGFDDASSKTPRGGK